MLCKYLAHSGKYFRHEVLVLYSGGSNTVRITNLGIKVSTIAEGGSIFHKIWALRLFLQNQRFSIVQAWLQKSCFVVTIATLSCSVPILWHIRSCEASGYQARTKILIRIMALLSNRPERIVSNTFKAREVYGGLGFSLKNWKVIPNGFDVDKFIPSPKKRADFRLSSGVKDDAILIGMFARFDPIKNHSGGMEILSRIREKHLNVKVLFVGPGCDKNNVYFSNMLKQHGMFEQAICLGAQRNVEFILPATDILFLPSFSEGFPNVVGEAMSVGVPCIASDVGDVKKIISQHGFVGNVHDPDSLYRYFLILLSMSKKRRLLMAKSARARIKDLYKISDIAKQFDSLIFDVTKHKYKNKVILD